MTTKQTEALFNVSITVDRTAPGEFSRSATEAVGDALRHVACRLEDGAPEALDRNGTFRLTSRTAVTYALTIIPPPPPPSFPRILKLRDTEERRYPIPGEIYAYYDPDEATILGPFAVDEGIDHPGDWIGQPNQYAIYERDDIYPPVKEEK